MSESFTDPTMVVTESKNFIIRYRAGIEPKDRIVYDSKTYNVESIIDDEERRHMLTILGVRVST
jgi:SPP1 family predicted phage head-tail adaptor